MIQVGKDVIAIRDHSQGLFKKGQIFTCNGIRKGVCGCIEIDIGFSITAKYLNCFVHNTPTPTTGIHWMNISRFAPLDDLITIEEILEDLKQPETISL